MATFRGSPTPEAGSVVRATASEIDIADANNYFDGTEVETALEELAVSVGLGTDVDIRYKSITGSVYTITNAELIDGYNIYGINYSGTVTITLPFEPQQTQIIVVKDESGNADTNNIQIVTLDS